MKVMNTHAYEMQTLTIVMQPPPTLAEQAPLLRALVCAGLRSLVRTRYTAPFISPHSLRHHLGLLMRTLMCPRPPLRSPLAGFYPQVARAVRQRSRKPGGSAYEQLHLDSAHAVQVWMHPSSVNASSGLPVDRSLLGGGSGLATWEIWSGGDLRQCSARGG